MKKFYVLLKHIQVGDNEILIYPSLNTNLDEIRKQKMGLNITYSLLWTLDDIPTTDSQYYTIASSNMYFWSRSCVKVEEDPDYIGAKIYSDSATLQDLVAYYERLFKRIIFYKAEKNDILDYIYSNEAKLKIEGFSNDHYKEERISYTITGADIRSEVLDFYLIDETSGTNKIVKNWTTYLPDNQQDFYIQGIFVIKTTDGKILEMRCDFTTKNRLDDKIQKQHEIYNVIDLDCHVVISDWFDISFYFYVVDHVSQFFFGGSWQEIVLKTSHLFKCLNINIDEILKQSIFYKNAIPYTFGGVYFKQYFKNAIISHKHPEQTLPHYRLDQCHVIQEENYEDYHLLWAFYKKNMPIDAVN